MLISTCCKARLKPTDSVYWDYYHCSQCGNHCDIIVKQDPQKVKMRKPANVNVIRESYSVCNG